MGIRIILADDHEIVRDGLRSLLELQPGMEVVAEAPDGLTTIRMVRELSPDVVVMDITMPLLNGIETTREILASNPDVKVIALSMHSERKFAVEMFKAGASGYLLKDSAFTELVHAIKTAVSHKIYVCPSMMGTIIQDYVGNKGNDLQTAFSLLTARERTVLQLLAEGKTSGKIASELFISERTVEVHRRSIAKKLGLQSIADLTKYAIREGLTPL